MHLRQQGFTYTACEPLIKNKEKIQKFTETRDSWYIYQSKLDIACFQQYKTYGDFKDLNRKTASGKMLCDKALNIAENPKHHGYHCGLASMVYKFFDKNTAGSNIGNKNISNKKLSE